jgi:hypothetical protein
MTVSASSNVALLYPGDRSTRDRADPAASRFAPLFAALDAAGVCAEPAVYQDDFVGEVEAQLRQVRVVLVWHNPIEGGRTRQLLDAMLRRVAAGGVLVSAHPDTILRMGTKDVLVAVRDLPFGSDSHRVASLAQLQAELPREVSSQRCRRRVIDFAGIHESSGQSRAIRNVGCAFSGGLGPSRGTLQLVSPDNEREEYRHLRSRSREDTACPQCGVLLDAGTTPCDSIVLCRRCATPLLWDGKGYAHLTSGDWDALADQDREAVYGMIALQRWFVAHTPAAGIRH